MAANSSIEWTTRTWQTVAGCTRISPGCGRGGQGGCYAEKMAGRLAAMAQTDLNAGKDPGGKRVYLEVVNQGKSGVNGYGPKSGWNRKVVTLPDSLNEPFRWRKPQTVFVNSMSDLFHADVPFEFIDRVFAVMALNPQHTFQVLTKRTERMEEYFNWETPSITRQGAVRHQSDVMLARSGRLGERLNFMQQWPLSNVWLGTSVEDQQRADERIPHLLRCPAAVRWLSCEPLLGPVNLAPAFVNVRNQRHLGTGEERQICSECHRVLALPDRFDDRFPSSICLTCCHPIGWVVVGGESGPNSAPCDVRWIRSIVEQCQTARVPVFVKQVGANPYQSRGEDGTPGFEIRLDSAKGGDPAEWAEDLRVRQMPGGAP